jgi:outer membrane immunogenic protein
MKKLLLGSVALIVMSAPVLAADMPVKVKPLPPAWSWTGCYVGLNVGYGAARFSKSDVRRAQFLPVALATSYAGFDFDDDGALGGVQIGCNWQNGQWVWGIEGDIQVTSIEARDRLPGLFGDITGANAGIFTEAQSALRWFGTARGRLGWTVTPDTLLYVTGGFAYGRVNSHLGFGTISGAGVVGAVGTAVNFDDQYHYGYTVGFGAEAKVARNFTAKLEYLYVDLGSADYAFNNIAGTFTPGGTVASTANYAWNQSVHLHVIRLGLNYQFNWYETVVAKY